MNDVRLKRLCFGDHDGPAISSNKALATTSSTKTRAPQSMSLQTQAQVEHSPKIGA
jgi:hypothetical protein